MSHLEVDLALEIPIAARHCEKILNLLPVAIAVLGHLVRLSTSLEDAMVDDRSPTAKAMSIVSQITSIGVSAALPVLIGYGLDGWLNTKPVFVLAGIVLGFLAAGFQFVGLVKKLEKDNEVNRE